MKQLIRSLLTFALVLVLLLGVVTPGLAADEAPPVIDARAAVMMDAASGNVLYSLNADTPLYVAGLTVMMTALLAAEAVDRGDIDYADKVTAFSTSQIDFALSFRRVLCPGSKASAGISQLLPSKVAPATCPF